MDAAPVLQPFRVHRFAHTGDFRPYRPYSSEQPDNLLENVHGVKEPNILVLGCGDLLSCFYTVWKNFRSGVTKEFDGVHFVLNDHSPGVIARDVVFLYLCLTTPHESLALRKWLCCFWSIWYSHDLLSEHQLTLDDILEKLILLSKSIATWSNPKNPLHKIVAFTSLDTLKKVRAKWIMWHQRSLTVRPVVHILRDTSTERKQKLNSVEAIVNAAFDSSKQSGVTADPRQSSMMQEVTDYLNTGSVYAEQVLIDEPVENSNTTNNLTFYERKDGKYALNYGSLPFNCYFQSLKYSRQELLSVGAYKGTLEQLLVRDYHFESLPYLSNSVQQLALWVRSCANTFKEDTPSIKFTFHCSDAMDFCIHLQTPTLASSLTCPRCFDLVDSSNLADQFALPILVLSALPLVKPGCVHLTWMRYKNTAPTLDDYIFAMFRVDLKFLPILLGVRCINHEGHPYTGELSVQPHSYQPSHMPPRRWKRTLVWERVSSLPLKHSSLLEKYESFASNLSFAVCNATVPLSMCAKGQAIVNHLCTEMAMRFLHIFASQVESDTSSYTFWRPLASLLSHNVSIRSYMHCLQTQAFLHGIHLHLTVVESTCPVCQRIPLTDHINQIRVPVDTRIVPGTPNFLVYIHQRPEISRRGADLQRAASADAGIQILDNITGFVEGDRLTLDFFVPVRFIEDAYSFTLVSYRLEKVVDKELDIPSIVAIKPLSLYKTSSITYSFHGAPILYQSPSTTLGILESHAGDESSFETVISVREQNVPLFDSLAPHQESQSVIHICMRSHKFVLAYPYPVNYDNLTIKISRKQKTVTVLANRAMHRFEEEKTFYLANTSDEFTKLLHPMNEQTMHTYTVLQFSPAEKKVTQDLMTNPTGMPPIVHIKQCLTFFLQCQHEHFFNVAIPVNNVHAMIVVQDRGFDVHRKSPVLDMAFTFLDLKFVANVAVRWQAIAPMHKTKCLTVSATQLELMRKILMYFAQRTVGYGLSKATGKYGLLRRHKIDQHFTRALVYPLYADPDAPTNEKPVMRDQPTMPSKNVFDKETVMKILENMALKDPVTKVTMTDPPNSTATEQPVKTEKKKPPEQKSSGTTSKKAAKVTQVKPSVSNQEKVDSANNSSHKVKKHKEGPSTTGSSTEKKRGCANCGEKVSSMKQCASCGKVKYCSRECQKKHWKTHKPDCKKASAEVDSDEDQNECSFCGKKSSTLKRCGACSKASYCDAVCQKKHWKEHKIMCKSSKD